MINKYDIIDILYNKNPAFCRNYNLKIFHATQFWLLKEGMTLNNSTSPSQFRQW
jgi:hypothetical protein